MLLFFFAFPALLLKEVNYFEENYFSVVLFMLCIHLSKMTFAYFVSAVMQVVLSLCNMIDFKVKRKAWVHLFWF